VGFIPDGAEWFLAEIVEEITVEGEAGNEIQIALVLIHATTPAEAYEKSHRHGTEREITYTNTDQRTVRRC
jgi:hypothetical protein